MDDAPPEPWWPLEHVPRGSADGTVTDCHFTLPNGQRIRVNSGGVHKIAKYRVYQLPIPAVGPTRAIRCDDELELRCILLKLAYPERYPDG